MGLYTQSQISKLRHEVNDIREDQERIVESVTENIASITNLEIWHKELNSTVAIFNRLNPGIVMAHLRSMYHHMLWRLLCIQCNRPNIIGLQSIFSLLKNCSTYLRTFSHLQLIMASNYLPSSRPIVSKSKRLTFTTGLT